MSVKYLDALFKLSETRGCLSPKIPTSFSNDIFTFCLCIDRFPFMGQPVPGAQTSDGQNHMQQAIAQVIQLDGGVTTELLHNDN